MTINLAAIESRNEERRRLRDAATPGPWDYRYYYCRAGVSDGSHKYWCGLKPELFGQCTYCHNSPPIHVHTDELGQNWHVHRFESDDWRTVYASDGTKVVGNYDYEDGGVVSKEEDAALIAYARTDTAPEDIAVLVAEVRRLAKAVADISHLASGHHREQPSHVLLHCLTIDIPAICDAALTTTTSE